MAKEKNGTGKFDTITKVGKNGRNLLSHQAKWIYEASWKNTKALRSCSPDMNFAEGR